MPIAALYDIHGNLPALEAVLEDIARAGADRVLSVETSFPVPCPVKLSSVCSRSICKSSSSLVMAK